MKDDTQHRTQTDTRYSDDVMMMFRQSGKRKVESAKRNRKKKCSHANFELKL